MAKRKRKYRRDPLARLSARHKDPLYNKWRLGVLKRDGKKCQYPGCPYHKNKVQVHHILPYAEFPHLRCNISNGITLCTTHHNRIKGRESAYVQLFLSILDKKDRGLST
jgi:5-methylcytosine-specific restriction endonuclease McrA